MAASGIFGVITEFEALNPVPTLLQRGSPGKMALRGKCAGHEESRARPGNGDRGKAGEILVSRKDEPEEHLSSMDANLSANSIVVAASGQVSCPLGEEAAILSTKTNMYYGLDPVGARVWAMLQEPRRVGELRDVIVNEFDVEAARCERDLIELLEKMRGEGLIEVRAAASQ